MKVLLELHPETVVIRKARCGCEATSVKWKSKQEGGDFVIKLKCEKCGATGTINFRNNLKGEQ